MRLYVARDKETGKLATSWELDVEPLDDNVFLSEKYPTDIPMLTIGQYEIVMLKEQSYMFKAIPKFGALDEEFDLLSLAELAGFDGIYVYGWYVDGFIVGKVMDYDDEYIALEYWVPVDPETVCLVDKEVGHEKAVCD